MPSPDFSTLLTAFAAAFAASLLLTPIARRVALAVGAVAIPKHDRWNRRTIPLLGGAAVWTAVMAAAAFTGILGPQTMALAISGGFMAVVGIVDDFLHLKPSTKLTAQIASACFLVLVGVTVHWTPSPIANALITIAWMVGVTNAINLLDNMDGLCAGVVGIAAAGFALSGAAPLPSTAYSAAIAGACAAFLVYNFNPASIFMGDGGSLFLGSSLATLAVIGEQYGATGIGSSVAVPALLLLIPLFDTVFVTVSRKLSARAASRGGLDHTSHRLVAMGFSERTAVLLLYLLSAVGGALAVALRLARLPETPVVLGLLLLVVGLMGIHLARVKVYGNGEDFSLLRDQPYTPLLIEMTYKRRVFEVLLDLALVTFSYYTAYVIRFDTQFDEYYDLLVRSLPIVIAVQLVSFFVVGVYRPVWRYFSASDITTYLRGVLAGTVTSVLVLLYLYRFEGYSRGVFIIYAMMLGVLLVGSRASFRILADVASRHGVGDDGAIICGAGDRGALLVRELRNNPRYEFRPVCFVDDDPSKQGRRIMGVPVAGGIDDLDAAIRSYEPTVVIVSTDKLRRERLDEIRRVCARHETRLLHLDFQLREIDVHPPRAAASR